MVEKNYPMILDNFVAAARRLEKNHPQCVDILHILSAGSEYDFSEIEQRLKEDPTRCLDFLRKGNLVIKNNNTYVITARGEFLLKATAREYAPVSKYS